MEIKRCKICNDEFESDLGYDENHCDVFCANQNESVSFSKAVFEMFKLRGRNARAKVIEPQSDFVLALKKSSK
jgi:hypothetical protein